MGLLPDTNEWMNESLDTFNATPTPNESGPYQNFASLFSSEKLEWWGSK